MEFFHYLEQTGFAAWIRESDSIWAYPTILFLHTIGLSIVVGINSAIDLRILGLAPRLPLEPLERLFPLMWVGFWVNAASGTLLLIADASTKLANPVFYIKMGFIALAIIDVFVIRKRVFRDPLVDKRPLTANAKILAAVSLSLWLGAITAGRLMAYLGPVSGLQQ
ncbi:MAG TPA: hypothetical protein VE422_12255 [Terriglobia bacterium]|nr:hypothetical protein [Terriglobia bacterium]